MALNKGNWPIILAFEITQIDSAVIGCPSVLPLGNSQSINCSYNSLNNQASLPFLNAKVIPAGHL